MGITVVVSTQMPIMYLHALFMFVGGFEVGPCRYSTSSHRRLEVTVNRCVSRERSVRLHGLEVAEMCPFLIFKRTDTTDKSALLESDVFWQ